MKTATAALVLTLLTVPAWPQTVTVHDVHGLVEYKAGDDWLPVTEGQELPVGSAVSTGFGGTAVLEVLGSTVTLRPLTRVGVDRAEQTSVGTRTRLSLAYGEVRAEVNPSTPASRTLFDVAGPGATVSVTGTGFEFDGEHVLVGHGEVHLATLAADRSVGGGEFSVVGRGTVAAPVAVAGVVPADLGAALAAPGRGTDVARQVKALPFFPTVSSCPNGSRRLGGRGGPGGRHGERAMRFLGLLVLAALAAACQLPVPSARVAAKGSALTLNFVMSGTGTAQAQGAGRLLLPTASTLTVTMTPQDGSKALSASVPIASGATVVPVSFNLAAGVYTVSAQASDVSGTVQFQQTASLTFSAAQSAVTLNLVPATTSSTNQLAYSESVSGTLAAGTAQSWWVPASALVSGGWGLTLTASASLMLFAQDSDGAAFPSADTVGTVTTVQVKNAGTSFITLYNPTGTTQSFQFVLSAPSVPTPQYKVTSWLPYFTASFAPSSVLS